MTSIFLDTVGLLALWDQRDQWHAAATAAYERLKASSSEFITTTFVLLECGNAAARRPYRHSVNRLRHELEASNLLITPTIDDWIRAWAAYATGDSTGAGIVDHVSFQVMRRVGIDAVFSNDRHFATAGFDVLF